MTEAEYARALQIDGAKCNIRFWRNMCDDTKAEFWRRRLAQLTGKAPQNPHPSTVAKNENREIVFDAIKGHMTVRELQEATGFSHTTIHNLTSDLLSAGRVDVVYRGGAQYWFRAGVA